ncbi:uncharacterized protein Z519_00709 [Cladophialophora bantiana CBS 173.52]|uniref:Rad21/Rec8-like protein N-terminal domain-containing protein n=1 Tax=Cladophialophora bantiana (strain ATCC 10958 / CBS 173.52 / CDC B-1940 / NIH 8579) TaxID=1442370 RepID=A0A0D2FAE5_CLAB1|nr:uncharacterized protein Z519_00709 [Cladophialophora bantiana CBS 173.52]KIW99046.1 hypothetical protein Z519_00709 [Cladophialophora bantiana CBS 173.52]
MFYSEQLLAKTGPLARVWLASNVERKLSKSQILQSDIQSSVGAIVDQGHAPMALRLSSQLMLGLARIYGRKVVYLEDDSKVALTNLRRTSKLTKNHDLPAHATTAADLDLPEILTVDDLFNMDLTFTMTQQPTTTTGQSQQLEEDWTSSLNPQQGSTDSMVAPNEGAFFNDDDLNLDFGEDDGIDMNDTTVSMNVGRNAQTPNRTGDEEGLLFDDDAGLNLDFGEDIPMPDQPHSPISAPAGDEGPVFGGDETVHLQEAAARGRDSESPLSEADPEVLRELDQTFQDQREEEIEEVAVQQRQRSRKQKPIAPDVETILPHSQFKAPAEDRSKILRPPSLLPRDPLLLTLINMQKNGDFVLNAMNDGRSKNWAPELQGLLSFEIVTKSGQLKRKRDSGIAGLSEDEHSEKSPRLEGPRGDMEDEGVELADAYRDITLEEVPQPMSAGGTALDDIVRDEDDGSMCGGDNTFDDTTMPLIHPADSGPISVGTQHAVHLLRERLGDAGSVHPSSPTKKSVLLQTLVPEGRTRKEDATKMFFEVLVLATKDAIKVEQGDKAIGLPVRIRAKRGLWGSWAETSPGDDPAASTASQQVSTSA